MMRLIRNSEPVIFEHKCSPDKKGQRMTDEEKRELLVENLLETYKMCGMQVSRCPKPTLSFLDKVRGKKIPSIYPDIIIEDFHGEKGQRAYYAVMPKGTSYDDVDTKYLPDFMQNSFVKIIFGSVFNMEELTPDVYINGGHYAFQYESTAILPKQENQVLLGDFNSKRLAEIFLSAWSQYTTKHLARVLDKDCHYDNDCVFDDMASREEFIQYLQSKFDLLKNDNSILRVALGRNGDEGEWSVIVKQKQNDGSEMVCAYMLECRDRRIVNIKIRQLELPDF